MHWNDLLDPGRAVVALLKLIALIFVVLVIGSVCGRALASAGSVGDGLWALFGFAVLSAVAYLVRERRLRQPPRPRTTRGAERTPLLPRIEEEE